MKNRNLIIVICSITAAICFGIVSCGNFFRGQAQLGGLFALLTLAQIALASVNYRMEKTE